METVIRIRSKLAGEKIFCNKFKVTDKMLSYRLQETRWKGNKARELGGGYKLIYRGADERGRNGVGVVLDPQTKVELVEVARKSSRIVRIKLVYGQEAINVISAYAPQVGCDDAEKETFWREMDEVHRRRGVSWVANGHTGQDNDGV
ncbi:hypothetical protein Pcinc_010703 [Petrolisthes cinctipes]|uniref:Uncharacterized protein n=1 Tax=Petrolisthes cinctipes TaxID=88211 RepID=A0AAE1G4D3_PETCI|nr:hypothetical protein Pcinc_010703 [Petrolisthes cinctipes]